jgi:tetratricopeptide (TPR) repeat protein
MVCAATGVTATQPRLAKTVHEVKERHDLVVFPPPAQLRAALLGWDAPAVDMLWAKLLVEYGMHFSEHREFTEIPRYVDAILELEPDYRPLYKYVDTMLAYRPMQGTESDVRLARAYLERGTRELPQDARVWLKYGQFIAFIAPSFLKDPNDTQLWRKEGAEAIERAVELGADPEEAMAATSMLSRAGATREAIRYLENAYAFTEHPSMREIHEAIGKRLEALSSISLRDQTDATERAIDARWARELPVVSRDHYLLLGPVTDPMRCAGPYAAEDASCARSWQDVTASPGSPEGSP